MDNPEYIGDVPEPEAKRRLAQGHSLKPPIKFGDGMFMIFCKCGWHTSGKAQDFEKHEHLAWMHITKPMQLVPASSDLSESIRRLGVKLDPETLRLINGSRTDRRPGGH